MSDKLSVGYYWLSNYDDVNCRIIKRVIQVIIFDEYTMIGRDRGINAGTYIRMIGSEAYYTIDYFDSWRDVKFTFISEPL